MLCVQNVVVLMLENRSFDEYFGMFPGALCRICRSSRESRMEVGLVRDLLACVLMHRYYSFSDMSENSSTIFVPKVRFPSQFDNHAD
jgi:phospholipase C